MLSNSATITITADQGVYTVPVDLPTGSQGFVGFTSMPMLGNAFTQSGERNRIYYQPSNVNGSDYFAFQYIDAAGTTQNFQVSVSITMSPDEDGYGSGSGDGSSSGESLSSNSGYGSGSGDGSDSGASSSGTGTTTTITSIVMGTGFAAASGSATGSGSGGTSSGTPPDAIDDKGWGYHGRMTHGNLKGGLNNQWDRFGNGAQFTLESDSNRGDVTIDPNTGNWTWIPDLDDEFLQPGQRPRGDFVGDETFTYRLTDENGSDTATVTITFTNTAPVAGVAEGYQVMKDTDWGWFNLSHAAHDLESDAITFSSTSPGVTMLSDGRFWYEPPAGVIGMQTLSYQAKDTLGATSTGVLKINIIPPTVSIQHFKDFSEVKTRTNYSDPASAGRDIGLFKVTRNSAGSALDVPVTFNGDGFTPIDSVASFGANETETYVAVQAEYNQDVDGLRGVRATISDPGAGAGYVRGNVSADIFLRDNDGYRWKAPPSLTITRDGYHDDTTGGFDISSDIALIIRGALNYSGNSVTWSGSWHSELYHVELTDHSLYGSTQYQFRLDPFTGKIVIDGTPTLPSLNPAQVSFWNSWLKYQALSGISFTGLGTEQVIIDYRAKAEFGYSGLSTSIGIDYGGVTAGVTMNPELSDVSAGLLQHIESELYEFD